MFKVLCGPVWKLPKSEVLGMTWSYVFGVLFCSRDEHGLPLRPTPVKQRGQEQAGLRQVLYLRGWPEHLIEAKVAEAEAKRQEEQQAARRSAPRKRKSRGKT